MPTLTTPDRSSCSVSTCREQQKESLRIWQEVSAQQNEPEQTGQAPLALASQSTTLKTLMNEWGNIEHRFAHDLANILTAIQGNTELVGLLLSGHSSAGRKYVQNILTANQRARELLQELLQGTHHRKNLQKEVRLSLLVDEVLEIFRATLPVTIRIEKIDRLSTSRIMGYPNQLFRMLSNLITNAARAMDERESGILTISLDNVLDTDPLPFPRKIRRTYIKLSVQDTGRGMTADLCRQIFSPLVTTQKAGKGMGLGLAIVKEVVTNHEGVVMVESEEGEGSMFTIYLPQIQKSDS